MGEGKGDLAFAPGIVAGRLSAQNYADNFSDLHPPLTLHEARVEADRCYFCYDAPCQAACPTSIDIPMFIREIAAGNEIGAAETILSSNILGGMCARVCPTETLCEEACVREAAEGKPVQIGLLQRRATDALLNAGHQPFHQGTPTGKRVAVVGAGPAGLACAHKLAELGHAVTLYDAREKLGGLNEFGLAAYKTTQNFAQREIDFVLSIGGIDVKAGHRLGKDIDLAHLRHDFDAVFLGVGLGGTNKLGLEDEAALSGTGDAVDYIAQLRQATNLADLPVGRRVIVIGGGMTAVDIAVQSKRLGADEVTIVYRRGPDQMKASGYEQELALGDGVVIRHWLAPQALIGVNGAVTGMRFERMQEADGQLKGSGETLSIAADVVFSAIGQVLTLEEEGVTTKSGRIVVDAERRTSLPGVWAGGDCIYGGQDLTVSAVEDGKQAAHSIDRALRATTK